MEWIYEWCVSARSPEGGYEVAIVCQDGVCGGRWRGHGGFGVGDGARKRLMSKKGME